MRRLLLILVCLVLPSHGYAHGGAADAEWIVGDRADGPTLLQMTLGMAARLDDGRWRFMCSYQWGGWFEPPSAPIGDGSALVFGNGGGQRIDAFDTVVPIPALETFTREVVRGAVATEDGVVVLRSEGGESTLHRTDGASVSLLATLVDDWDVVVPAGPAPDGCAACADDDLRLAAVVDGTFVDARLGRGGEELSRETFAIESGDSVWRVETAAGRGFVTLRNDTQFWLYEEIDGALVEVATASIPISGPVDVDGVPYFVASQRLHRVGEAGAELVDESRLFASVDTAPSGTYVASSTGVHVLEPGGVTGAQVFSYEDLGPPWSVDLNPTDQVACIRIWAEFAFYASIDRQIEQVYEEGGLPPEEPDAGSTADGGDAGADASLGGGGGGGGGCSAAGAVPGPWWAAVWGLLLAARRRR